MRKILSIVMVLALAMALAAPAMAAKDSFVPSIGYKDGPEIVGGDLVDCLENTSISEAEKGETSISQEDRELLLDIYQQLVDGTMKLPIENDRYVIRDLAQTAVMNTTSDRTNDAIAKQIAAGNIAYDRIVYFEKDLDGRITAL